MKTLQDEVEKKCREQPNIELDSLDVEFSLDEISPQYGDSWS